MKRTWIVVYAVSLLVGLALWRLAPERWGLEFPQAMLLGSALYFGALHRYTLRATEGAGAEPNHWVGLGGLLPGLLLRSAFFLALAGLQALACFEWMPTADVRGGFVLSATWLVSLSLIDRPAEVKTPKAV
jgi:hypothetical protein